MEISTEKILVTVHQIMILGRLIRLQMRVTSKFYILQ